MFNSNNSMSKEEIFLNRPPKPEINKTSVRVVEEEKEKSAGVSFEESLLRFSSKNVAKKRKRKKNKFGTDAIIRLIALCLCLGVLAFSVSKIFSRLDDLSGAKEAYAALLDKGSGSAIPAVKTSRTVSLSKDLLTFLGDSDGGIDMLNTDTRDYYDSLRETVLKIQKVNSDCWGYVVMSDSNIKYPIMKAKNNDYYLNRLYNGEISKAGSIFADYRLKDNYSDNRNVVLYGHCMSDGSMFRSIKLFFDSANRYSRAQTMEITIVTADSVYVYEYFAGYRAEGDAFTNCYTINSNNKAFYNFLRGRRALNTISKDVYYDADSKIITLVTCTNIPSKPGERYVLHGILKNSYSF